MEIIEKYTSFLSRLALNWKFNVIDKLLYIGFI